MSKRSIPKYKKCYQSKKFIWDSLALNNKIHKFKSRKWSIIQRNLNKDSTFFREPFVKRFRFFYSTNLQLKRLLKSYFCGFSEKKFKNMYKKTRTGPKSKNFIFKVNSCLDSVLLKTGLFSSIHHVRFYIRYIGIDLNGLQINVSKTILKEGDFISLIPVKNTERNKVKNYLDLSSKISFINHGSFEFDYSTLSFVYLNSNNLNKEILNPSVLSRVNFFYNK